MISLLPALMPTATWELFEFLMQVYFQEPCTSADLLHVLTVYPLLCSSRLRCLPTTPLPAADLLDRKRATLAFPAGEGAYRFWTWRPTPEHTFFLRLLVPVASMQADDSDVEERPPVPYRSPSTIPLQMPEPVDQNGTTAEAESLPAQPCVKGRDRFVFADGERSNGRKYSDGDWRRTAVASTPPPFATQRSGQRHPVKNRLTSEPLANRGARRWRHFRRERTAEASRRTTSTPGERTHVTTCLVDVRSQSTPARHADAVVRKLGSRLVPCPGSVATQASLPHLSKRAVGERPQSPPGACSRPGQTQHVLVSFHGQSATWGSPFIVEIWVLLEAWSHSGCPAGDIKEPGGPLHCRRSEGNVSVLHALQVPTSVEDVAVWSGHAGWPDTPVAGWVRGCPGCDGRRCDLPCGGHRTVWGERGVSSVYRCRRRVVRSRWVWHKKIILVSDSTWKFRDKIFSPVPDSFNFFKWLEWQRNWAKLSFTR